MGIFDNFSTLPSLNIEFVSQLKFKVFLKTELSWRLDSFGCDSNIFYSFSASKSMISSEYSVLTQTKELCKFVYK